VLFDEATVLNVVGPGEDVVELELVVGLLLEPAGNNFAPQMILLLIAAPRDFFS